MIQAKTQQLFNRQAFRQAIPSIALIVLASALIMSLVVFIHLQQDVPIGTLTRDPVALAQLPSYTGLLSQLGIYFWAGSAILSFSTAYLVLALTKNQNREQLQIGHFFLASATLSLLLGLDDTFLLHESVFPYMGIPQNIVLLTYAFITLVYLIAYFECILKTNYWVLFFALFSFAISVLLDVINPPGINPYFFEDGAKLLGLVAWLSYFFISSHQVIHTSMKTALIK